MKTFRLSSSQKRRAGICSASKKIHKLKHENIDCTLTTIHKQTHISDYFRVINKCQSIKQVFDKTINTGDISVSVNSKMDCTSNTHTHLSNKSQKKRRSKFQLDNNMHVISDDDDDNNDLSESNDDFVERDYRTSRKQSVPRNKSTNYLKSPRKKQRMNEENTQPNNSQTNVKTDKLINNKNTTPQGSNAKEKISGNSNKFKRNKLNKSNVSRNIFPEKTEKSVQADLKNKAETNIAVSSRKSMLGISENCTSPGVNRTLNVSTQVNSEDITVETAASSQQTQTGLEKKSTDTESPNQMSKSVTLQTHKTSGNETNAGKKKTSSLPTPQSSPSKQNTLTQMNFKTNKTKTPNQCTSPEKTNTLDKSKIKEKIKNSKYNTENNERLCENVRKIFTWVFEIDYFKILFTKKEIVLIHELFKVEDKRQIIICLRLYTRLPKWYNLQNLCKELRLGSGNEQKMLQHMLEHKFVDNDFSNEPILDLLANLSMEDLRGICNSFKLKMLIKKQSMIDALVNHSKQQSTLTSLKKTKDILLERVTEKMGVCVKLSSVLRDLFTRVHHLYSLPNSELETPNDIYFRMGKLNNESLKYPKVKVELTNIFKDRQQFLSYQKSLTLRDEFLQQKTKKDIENEYLLCKEAFVRLKELLSDDQLKSFHIEKPLFLRRFSEPWVYCSVLYSGSQNLGKHYPNEVCEWLSYMLKQEIYCVRKRGLWYIHKCLVQKTHVKDLVGEATTIRDGLSDKWVTEVNKYELSERGSKVKKGNLPQLLYDEVKLALLPKCDLPISREISATAVHNNEPGRKKHFVNHTADGMEYLSVEQIAIIHYTTELSFTDGIHCEGHLLTTLFFILFWDIIYQHHVPNTYISLLQCIPLDLYSGEFYENRSEKINARLQDIRDTWNLDTLCQYVSEIYKLHTDELKSVHPHDFGDDTAFQMYVKCIGKNVLAAVCHQLAKDYKQFRSGLPDLFLWDTKEYKCCFVEVKSENDTLSTNQILWLNYLKSVGADVEICYVKNIGSKSRKKIKTKCNEQE